MNTQLDHHTMNHMITAVSQEMSAHTRKPRPECDTLFIGGRVPSVSDQHELAQFGLRKNWKIIYPSFDAGAPSSIPASYHVVVTDGLAETMVLSDGRLWKKDRRSQAILVFAKHGVAIKVSSKGRLVVRGMADRYHDYGYDLALQSVTARAARQPGHAPVLSNIGMLPTVLDIHTLKLVFENGE